MHWKYFSLLALGFLVILGGLTPSIEVGDIDAKSPEGARHVANGDPKKRL